MDQRDAAAAAERATWGAEKKAFIEDANAVCAEMQAQGLYRVEFHFDEGGAKVLLNSAPAS